MKVTKLSKNSINKWLKSGLSSKPTSRFYTFPRYRLVVTFGFIIVATALLAATKAASTITSFEPEDSSLSSNVQTGSDSNASGGGYIKFGTGNGGCSNVVNNYTYQVPFGNSPWNTMACSLPVFGNNQSIAQGFGNKMFNYASFWNASQQYWFDRLALQKSRWATQFALAGANNDYSTPIYYANASTPRKKIKICGDGNCLTSNLDKDFCWETIITNDTHCLLPDNPIPYDPAWKASGGNDREMIVIDTVTHYSYELWQVDPGNASCAGADFGYALVGKDPASRLCLAGAKIIRDSSGNPASIYSYNQGVIQNRGMGIENTAMIVTPEEVAAGEIRHALTMEIAGTSFGPQCDTSNFQTSDASLVSKMCAFAVAPATMVEWKSTTQRPVTTIGQSGACGSNIDLPTSYPPPSPTFAQLFTVDKTIPEGMRFRINMTDAQIDAWLDQRAADYAAHPGDPDYANDAGFALVNGQPTAKRKTAKIFAQALSRYGWIVGDTTCYGAGFTTAGSNNDNGTIDAYGNAISGGAKQQWANLGIADSTSQYLLEGLFTGSNILAVEPPTVTCKNNATTKFIGINSALIDSGQGIHDICPWISSTY